MVYDPECSFSAVVIFLRCSFDLTLSCYPVVSKQHKQHVQSKAAKRAVVDRWKRTCTMVERLRG